MFVRRRQRKFRKANRPHGRYIGQVRAYEGVSLEQLAQGLCTKSYLCRVENGEREAGKLLTDALLQRLGKPVERFDRILDWNEYQQWLRRQSIWRHLSAGEVSLAAAAIQAYQATDVLEHQFLQTARLNLRALQGRPQKSCGVWLWRRSS